MRRYLRTVTHYVANAASVVHMRVGEHNVGDVPDVLTEGMKRSRHAATATSKARVDHGDRSILCAENE
jgi:hypothetical protein